jgi:hypothetical protein
MIKNNNLILSQSVTKDLGLYVIDDQLEQVDWCAKKVYHKHVANDYPDTRSSAMEDGLVFETLLLGGGARGQSQSEISLKKNGGRRVLQDRIEIQAHRMYGYMYAKGVEIDQFKTQVPLIAKYANGIWIRGELDLFPVKVNGELAIIDAKSTKDVRSDFFTITMPRMVGCSNSSWGNLDDDGTPKTIAKNQPLFYHFLARNFEKTGLDGHIKYKPENADMYSKLFSLNYDYSDISFYWFVAGLCPDLNHQIKDFKYDMTPMRWALLDNLVNTAVNNIRGAIQNNFKPNPKESLCKSCALKDTCEK